MAGIVVKLETAKRRITKADTRVAVRTAHRCRLRPAPASRPIVRSPRSGSGSDERKRIDARPLHAHPPVQMRGGDAAGCAGESDDLAVLHDVAAPHVDSREVRIKRV